MQILQNIVNRANKLDKKIKKKDAFNLLIEVLQDRATDSEKAALYRFFMPDPIKDMLRKKWKWVSSATNPKDPRWFCTYVFYSEYEYKLKAASGHVLHIVDIDDPELTTGFYDTDGVKKEDFAHLDFPNIKHVTPKGDYKILKVEDLDLKVGIVLKKDFVYIIRDKVGVSKKYLDNAMAFSENGVCKYFAKHKKITVEHPGAIAIISLMRL